MTVRVGAVTSGGVATRACEAVLSWKDHRVVAVHTAAQIDIDVLGADLGFDMPVVAFTVRPAPEDGPATYEIWSLQKNPQLLRTLTGGGSYRAADAALNGQVAIWATDAAPVDAFDGLPYSDYTSPPLVALRFEHGTLVDVSAWYRAQYDQQISELRRNLTPEALAQFRNTNGHLNSNSLPCADAARLRNTKAAVLEIVWAYLDSGRPDRAWAELDAAWPALDVARIKAAIIAAHSRGIEAQVAKVASANQPPNWLKRSAVYEYLKPVAPQELASGTPTYDVPGLAGHGAVPVKDHISSLIEPLQADTEPQPISLWRPLPSENDHASAFASERVILTIDEAGKVTSASMQAPTSDPELLNATKDWKFIPATHNGNPVAYKLNMDIQPLR